MELEKRRWLLNYCKKKRYYSAHTCRLLRVTFSNVWFHTVIALEIESSSLQEIL